MLQTTRPPQNAPASSRKQVNHKKGLYNPIPERVDTPLGIMLSVAFSVPRCGCKQPRLPKLSAEKKEYENLLEMLNAEDYEITLADHRLIAAIFRGIRHPQYACPHMQELRECWLHKYSDEDVERKHEVLLRALLAYDPQGYDPVLRWRSPVWLSDGRYRLNVGKAVMVASQKAWTAVYACRAENHLPLFHPKDRNPRNLDLHVAMQGRAGNRQGSLVNERYKAVRQKVKPLEYLERATEKQPCGRPWCTVCRMDSKAWRLWCNEDDPCGRPNCPLCHPEQQESPP